MLAFIILVSFGNLSAIDALIFAVSACTESGLTPVDVKDLHLAQQVVLYIFPVITNNAIVNIFVVFVRIRAFEKQFREIGMFPKFPKTSVFAAYLLSFARPVDPEGLQKNRHDLSARTTGRAHTSGSVSSRDYQIPAISDLGRGSAR